MQRRPVLVWVLIILHFLEPIIKTLALGLLNEASPLEIIQLSTTHGIQEILEYWLLFPMGGLALYLMRNWSFWVFIGVQAYSIIALASHQNHALPSASASPHIASLALVFANAVFLLYVFLPSIRDLFFDSHIRRWEVRSRHRLTIPCSLKIEGKDEHIECEIKNISETGAFLFAPLEIDRDLPITLHFNFYHLHFTIAAKIMSAHETDGQKGLGVQFIFVDLAERLHMKRLNKALELLGL